MTLSQRAASAVARVYTRATSNLSPEERLHLATEAVRALLLVVREPSPEMLLAGVSTDVRAYTTWQAMVDAAINESGGS